jgi:HPt (histidine-containing phosphotransfer) domain-containing protein
MDDYVTKPLQPKVLFSAIDRWTQVPDFSREAVDGVQDYSASENAFSADLEEDLFGETAPPAAKAKPAADTRQAAPVFQNAFPADTLPVDFESALPHFDGDREFMMDMFKQYKEQLRERVTEIHSALQDQDANRLARLAHNLKGVSLNFSANPLASITLSLEEICKREDLTHAPHLVAQLEAEAQRLTDYLTKHGI